MWIRAVFFHQVGFGELNRQCSWITYYNTVVIDEKSCSGTPTVTDYEGNVYATVQIGQQCWMRDNLRTRHYSDGIEIPIGTTSSANTSYYYNYSSSSIPLPQRGYLYNWSAVMHGASSSEANPSGVQGICPIGWHVPSDAEWTLLTDYVKSQSDYVCGTNTNTIIAKSLAATTEWNTCTNTCAVGNNLSNNNATGFSALPAGIYSNIGYLYSGYYTYFWSTTDTSNSNAWYRSLSYVDVVVHRSSTNKYNGYSVRCLRD